VDEIKGIGILTRVAAACQRPYYEAKPMFTQIWQENSELDWRTPLTAYIMPNLMRSSEHQAATDAHCLALRIACALRQFKHAQGAYPANPEALVPAHLAVVPLDPFSGRPFIYRTVGNGFVLYSVGANGQDDHGNADKQADIVCQFKT